MKKMMITACAIAFAAVAQAASISWAAAVANPGSDGPEPAENQYVYLLFGTTDANLATTITLSALTDVGTDVIGATANNGYSVVAAYKLNPADAENGSFLSTFTRADTDGGVNGFYQIILADASNSKFAVEKFDAAVSGVTDNTGAGSISFNAEWNTEAYLGANGFTGTFAVPEPTSGLLMLVGLAGLALRRRRA